jgi:hypothetical protein
VSFFPILPFGLHVFKFDMSVMLTERVCAAAFEIVIPEEKFCEYKEGM